MAQTTQEVQQEQKAQDEKPQIQATAESAGPWRISTPAKERTWPSSTCPRNSRTPR
jgi:hypothetical protein